MVEPRVGKQAAHAAVKSLRYLSCFILFRTFVCLMPFDVSDCTFQCHF